ncbi:MAG: zf-TFIIB domain-containing protein [Planctomycetes bacterium]|nr:zf-TFIIB domain-containing protein [Planctomycetota bacterium]
MKCPACSNALTATKLKDIVVDVCQNGCGGIWFDQHEFERVDEAHEHEGEALLDIPRNESVRIDFEAPLECPRCEHQVMRRHFHSTKRKVEIDECYRCGGVWLDAGELKKIRKMFQNDEDRKQAAREYYEEAFGQTLQDMKQQSLEELQKARRFANALRWVCPSYYIPGDQKWGAF